MNAITSLRHKFDFFAIKKRSPIETVLAVFDKFPSQFSFFTKTWFSFGRRMSMKSPLQDIGVHIFFEILSNELRMDYMHHNELKICANVLKYAKANNDINLLFPCLKYYLQYLDVAAALLLISTLMKLYEREEKLVKRWVYKSKKRPLYTRSISQIIKW